MIQPLSDALAERGYDTLTPVQLAVTAPELLEADLLVSAQTGSGKTVGFGLAIAPTLLDGADTFAPAEAPLALIVAPTRELAFQVARELSWLYARTGARVVTCVGGMDMRDERRALDRGAHIVVGTPGRLRDHIQRGSLVLGALRAAVLDEADEMLDLGFREDLEFILGEAPGSHRTLMFSATVPPMIVTLAQRYQRDAVRVATTSEQKQHADIAYQALRVAAEDAENAVINMLRYHDAQNAIVFANTRATVNRLTARFANRGFAVVCLSGELSQSERSHALQAMRDGRARVCVATDVAARGIDLPNLELVIHAELPSNAEGLLHRSGRTGRAGRKGISALVVPPKSVKRAERLLKTARVVAEWTTAPDADQILRRDEERLLTDPAWEAEITPDEAAFAERLLAGRTPQEVAAAYLRLHRARHSAPEDLSDPDARPTPKERTPFGPSGWVVLSVGRADRAEARWLLPLLCRAGGLTKEAIGAIRVQPSETFVEIAEARLPGFLQALGEGGTLEDGVTVRLSDGPPAPAPARRASPSKPRATPAEPAHDARAPVAPADVPAVEERPEAARATRPDAAPRPEPRKEPQDARPDKPRHETAKKSARKPFGSKPRKDEMRGSGTAGSKPRGTSSDAPARSSAASDTSKRFTPPGQPGSKPAGKSRGKPGGKPFGKAGGNAGGKSGAKAAGKPGGPPRGTSGGKPGRPGAGKGGDARPTRAARHPGGARKT